MVGCHGEHCSPEILKHDGFIEAHYVDSQLLQTFLILLYMIKFCPVCCG